MAKLVSLPAEFTEKLDRIRKRRDEKRMERHLMKIGEQGTTYYQAIKILIIRERKKNNED